MKTQILIIVAILISIAGLSQEDNAFSYLYRGNSKFNLEDYRGAIQDFTKAIELDPKEAEAYYWRGLAKIYLDEKDGGCLDLSKAGELGEEDAYDAIRDNCN
jgi:tetratricopeptide (TPR) repeat protein